MKKLLGRINTKKIIITMLLLELANVIIQTSLTLSAEIIQKPDSANKITITFNNALFSIPNKAINIFITIISTKNISIPLNINLFIELINLYFLLIK